jgi:putative ribosome biogenesis GTPase RsgA
MQDKKSISAQTDSHSANVASELETVRRSITDVYGEELFTAIQTGMAVVASLSFKGVSTPISLLYEGGSGRGKSTIINILDPDRDATKARIYRLDKFTPKSFVTHAANVSPKSL